MLVLMTDKYDERKYRESVERFEGLREGMEEAKKVIPESLSFSFGGDLFHSFYKAHPQIKEHVPPEHMVFQRALETLFTLPQYKELRAYSVLDEVVSSFGAAQFLARVRELIPEEARRKIERAEEIKQALSYVRHMLSERRLPRPWRRRLEREREELGADLGRVRIELKRILNKHTSSDSFVLKVADIASKTAEEVRETVCALSWGVEPGSSAFIQMEEKRKALELIASNPKFRDIVRLAGRMRKIAARKRAVKVEREGMEIADVGLGDDYGMMADEEYLGFADPNMFDLFLMKLLDRELLVYRGKAEEELGRGPLVVCVDGSGSMTDPLYDTTKEVWAKAFAFVMYSIAREEKRDYALINFGSKTEIEVFEFPKDSAHRIDDVAHAFTHFFEGGTDFETPLRKACELIGTSRYKDADVVFITDGECEVSEGFLKDFRRLKDEKKFRVYSIAISLHARGRKNIEKFSDEVVGIDSLVDPDVAYELFRKV